MFNLLVHWHESAWEIDSVMRMPVERFNRYSGSEAQSVSLEKPESLASLEGVPALLMYERGSKNADIVRHGFVRHVKVFKTDLLFSFELIGLLPRSAVEDFDFQFNIEKFEHGRTHWALKDGTIPQALLNKVEAYYDVALSFAGEDREYVKQVASHLNTNSVSTFYDEDEEVNLWGRNLIEQLDSIYRKGAKYCVMFISKHYADKMWTRHERRSALTRALEERTEYVLPARFDQSDIPGLPPSVLYIDLRSKKPEEFAGMILRKLGRG